MSASYSPLAERDLEHIQDEVFEACWDAETTQRYMDAMMEKSKPRRFIHAAERLCTGLIVLPVIITWSIKRISHSITLLTMVYALRESCMARAII